MNIRQLENCPAEQIPEEVLFSSEPILLKGLVAYWPVVQAANISAQSAAQYIQSFDKGLPLTAYEAPSDVNGRIFYNDDFTGFNFSPVRQTLSETIEKLFQCFDDVDAPTYYIGSTMIDHWLSGFRQDNDIGLGGRESLVSIWLGNKSSIAAHYDFPNNIACSVAGRRRFTLFPPEQSENLYVGPLDFTPSGQPISLVDSKNPDFEKYPKYKQALAASCSVELEVGDAIFIPSMWWHQVDSLEPFNVLVNYWWRSTPAYLGSPLNALKHAVMSLHGLPKEQRDVWRDIFDQYVFGKDEQAFDHIPEHVRTVLTDINEETANAIRSQLIRVLK